MRRVKYMINTSNIDSTVSRIFVYVADTYKESDLMCDITTIAQFKDGDYVKEMRIFNFKYNFNGDIEFNTVDSCKTAIYNDKLVKFIKRLKLCMEDFKNGTYRGSVIRDGIIDVVKELFKGDPNFCDDDIIPINMNYDELVTKFKYNSITVSIPKKLDDVCNDDQSVIIKFDGITKDNYDCEYIEEIRIINNSFSVDYMDEYCSSISAYTMNTYILPVLDILSNNYDDNKVDKLIKYLKPHVAINAKTFDFKLY